jgi:hypothetical protein
MNAGRLFNRKACDCVDLAANASNDARYLTLSVTAEPAITASGSPAKRRLPQQHSSADRYDSYPERAGQHEADARPAPVLANCRYGHEPAIVPPRGNSRAPLRRLLRHRPSRPPSGSRIGIAKQHAAGMPTARFGRPRTKIDRQNQGYLAVFHCGKSASLSTPNRVHHSRIDYFNSGFGQSM